MNTLDAVDRALINTLQDGLPIEARPFAALAAELGLDEETLVERLQALAARGLVFRIGPLYNAERFGGALTLAALHAPEATYEAIAERVNRHPEVAHNYRREHHLNMWFVVAAETPHRLAEVLAEIETETGCRVFDFSREAEFHVDLRFPV
ncbi:MAG: protein NirG [Gammaproteobacteria bacterium]|nr:MAG: protein NirG [Gammaproteobacteria bacterium]